MERSQAQKTSIVLSFDNDKGGRGYVRHLKKRYPHIKFKLDMPRLEKQDWNDVLMKNKKKL
jgi:DNA primase